LHAFGIRGEDHRSTYGALFISFEVLFRVGRGRAKANRRAMSMRSLPLKRRWRRVDRALGGRRWGREERHAREAHLLATAVAQKFPAVLISLGGPGHVPERVLDGLDGVLVDNLLGLPGLGRLVRSLRRRRLREVEFRAAVEGCSEPLHVERGLGGATTRIQQFPPLPGTAGGAVLAVVSGDLVHRDHVNTMTQLFGFEVALKGSARMALPLLRGRAGRRLSVAEGSASGATPILVEVGVGPRVRDLEAVLRGLDLPLHGPG